MDFEVPCAIEVGFYGKLPSHGDFLKRRVLDSFLNPWDEWLQAGIAASRESLGPHWPEVYLTSPVWRFAAAANACGREAVGGLIAPSVDRVGRYFPLTVMWRLPEDLNPFSYATVASGWLDRIEQLLVDALTAEAVDFEHFDQQLCDLAVDLNTVIAPSRVRLDLDDTDALIRGQNPAWQIPTGASHALDATLQQLLYRTLQAGYEPLTLWWTEGSAAVEPSCLLRRGLPPPEAFAALLTGSWAAGLWRTVRSLAVPAPVPVVEAPAADSAAPSPAYRSAALTDPGPIRKSNQDAFLERAEIGLWVVADGLGGLSDGEVASRMVCDVLAGLVPGETLEATIEDVQLKIEEVNGALYRASVRPLDPVESGSTVVVFLTRGDRAALIWAGDSRVYRLRDGDLQLLTTDHSLDLDGAPDATLPAGSAATSEEPIYAITRAVGGEESLALDVRREVVRAADRYLLCSDGLTRALDDRALAGILTEPDPATCARRLIAAAVDASAADNVTVIVVDAA
jgi:type VI secretion system protein ImpM